LYTLYNELASRKNNAVFHSNRFQMGLDEVVRTTLNKLNLLFVENFYEHLIDVTAITRTSHLKKSASIVID